ncbi:MAG TPA: D-cysteine desulfhydrase family protein [Ignavibacteria bacterium]|nr:D-cysteine desulfhydrase family protein [Ignavibacteria bacterium]
MFEKKTDLCFLPTPLHPLKNLSQKYPGHRLYIKRDDLTGLAGGGNKARKLEYLIFDALNKNCDTIITGGAQQSNHCRQTAAACAVVGLKCHLALGGNEPEKYEGNLLSSFLFGAKIHFTGEHRKGEDIPGIKSDLERKNKKCCVIPYGGSNVTGALGFVNAVSELKDQLEEMSLNIDHIFFASSSGGTQAGLILGSELFNLKSELMPVNIDKEDQEGLTLEENILNILNNGADLLNIKKEFSAADVKLIRGYDSPGYGVVTGNESSAIKQIAESEGILLDPVYTGRAFYAMLDHLEKKKLKTNSNILFLHTGGLPVYRF